MSKQNKNKKEIKSKRSFFSYSEEKMNDAIKAVKENVMSQKKVLQLFEIPRSTLIKKLSVAVPLNRKMGPSTELSAEEATLLVNWILSMAKKGPPVHRTNLLSTVKHMLGASDRKIRYITVTPGRSWFEGFLKRHPNIKQKHAKSLSKSRAAVTQDRIEEWFDEILVYLRQEELDDIVEDPARIFNDDEVGFHMCPKSDKVLGPATYKEDFYQRVNSEKEQITVMASFFADGRYVPPMLIFPYKKMPKVIVESVPENWGLGRSDSGWMNSEVFFEYISNHFIPYLKSENIIRPVILFVDGHRSHMTQEVSLLCDENGIILISLYPNCTHILQPADVLVFKPLKAGWTFSVRNWKFKNFPKEVTRFTFGSILKSVFDEYATVKTIQNGFRKCGLYPFSEHNVDYSKCIPNRIIGMPNDAKQTSNFSNKVLAVMESKIDKKDLDDFKDSYNRKENWSGNIESTNIYKVWLSIKNESTAKPQEERQIETGHLIDDTASLSTNLIAERNTADTKRSRLENVNLEGSPKKQIGNDQDKENSITLIEKINNGAPIAYARPNTSCSTPENASITHYDEREHQGFKIPTPFKKCIVSKNS